MRYRIETIVQEKLNETNYKTSHYIREVSILCGKKQQGLYKYSVHTLKFHFPKKANTLQYILKKIAYLFDELELGVDDDRKICKVYNLSTLKSQWQFICLELLEENRGYAIEDYCTQISNLLSKEDKLIDFLHQKEMLGMFFNIHNGVVQEGQFYYDDNQVLEEGFSELKKDNYYIKYSILWFGF